MGALRAGFHGTVGQPSAQVIEGSLRFDSTKKQYLKRTPSSVGNQKTFTLSGWFKLSSISSNREFLVSGTSNSERTRLIFSVSDAINFYNRTGNTVHDDDSSAALFRDTSSFYHVVISIDNLNTTGTFYVNGESVHTFTTVDTNSYINSTTIHYIGGQVFNDNNYYNGYISQLYLIDGQALGPEYFGFTDPLTNTWRPKKFVPTKINDGTTWSSNVTGNIYGGSSANVFDGEPSADRAEINSSDANDNHFTLSSMSVRASKVGVYVSNSGNDVEVSINGSVVGTISSGDITSSSKLFSFTFAETTVTSIKVRRVGSTSGWYLYGINLNDVPLIDGATSDFGVNGFYLPFDGNSPIGEDKSGNGNDWTPVSFGGSVELPKATGALPILKTNEAGTVAKPGARTDRKSYTVTASGGRYYLDGTEAPILNAYRGGSYTFDYTGATSHPFYLSSLQDGKHNSEAYSVEFNGTTSSKYLSIDDTADLRLGTGDWTIEEFVYIPTGTTMPSYWVNSLCIGGESNSEVGASIYHTSAAGGNDNSVAGGVSYIGPSNSYRLFHRIDTRGRWVHVAVTRESGTVRLFVDGNLSDSIADTTNYNGTSGSKIGVGNISQINYLNGKVSNVRVVKGQALYTSNFTPPSTTLTTTSQGAIASNVKLLCCQDNDPTNATVIPTGSTISNNNGTAAVNSSPFLYDINGYYGINTATSNTTKITIPHWAPDTLYYYCNVHSGMGSSINITTDIFKADPYAWKNVLSLPLVGGEEDVSNHFNIESTTKVTTANGGVTSSTQSNFYSSSYSFDATDDYISIPTDSDFRFGYHDWTIECWHYSTKSEGGTSTNTLMGIWNTSSKRSWLLNLYGSRFRAYFSTDGGASPNIYEVSGGSSYPVKANRWYHVAAVKEGNNFHLFQDGVLVDTRSDVVDLPSFENTTDELRIGARTGGTNFTNGYIQDVRIYKGVAKYTGTTEGVQYFVPASTNPDVLPDTPSGVSGGSKLTKITEGAVSIAGTTDYLVVSDSTDLELGGGDFTIEAYINPTGTPGGSGYNCIFAKGESLQCYFMSGGSLTLYASTDYSNNGYDIINGSGLSASISLNRWHHLAVCRSGDTWKIFLDGIEGYSGTHSGTIEDNAHGFSIGDYAPSAGSYDYQGFISNFRVVKGTALYTSDFTPPTSPLTNVTNTKLLCCQSNTSASVAAVTPNVPGSGINDGTIWSANVSASTGYIVDAGLGFDGSTSTAAYASSSASDTYIYIDFSTALSGTFKLWTGMASGSPTATVTHSGGSSSVSLSSGENSLGTFTSVTRIAVNRGEAATHSFQAIAVDDVQLLDPIAVGGETSATNFNPFTDDINTIRGQETGYATWNPLFNNTETGGNGPISDGNLYVAQSVHGVALGNFLMSSGKWYFEALIENGNMMIGVMGEDYTPNTQSYNWNKAYGIYPAGTKYVIAGSMPLSPVPNTTNVANVAALYGVLLDIDNRKMWIHKDGKWTNNNPFSSTTADVTLDANSPGFYAWFHSAAQDGNNCTANFGQKPFKFPPPDGYQPLNVINARPETVIVRPDQYVGVTTYTGDNDPNHPIVVGLKPDLVWIKSRDANRNHRLTDTVRDVGKEIYSDIPNGEGTVTDGVTSFTDNGFVLGANNNYNYTEDYVSWCWKAGGNKNTFNIDDVGYATAAAAGLDGGSIAVTGASVGTKQGFSIIKYTGIGGSSDETISHGLSQSPNMVIIKNLTDSVGWVVAHTGTDPGNNRQLRLDTNDDVNDVTFLGLSKSNFTSTTFAVNASDNASNFVNTSSKDYIAYVWHDVPGLQKFGRYEGNGDANGPYVELGFKPAILWLKNIDDNENWYVYDTERSPHNVAYQSLQLSHNGPEETGNTNTRIDILSSGFKLRQTNGPNNSNSYIYCAWAEAPSFNLYGGQSNAR